MYLLAATDLVDYASRGGIIGLLIILLYGGFRKDPWWVFGWVYRDLDARYDKQQEQLDSLRQAAIKGVNLAELLADKKSES